MIDFELISESEFDGLPDDPEQCFVAYEAIVRRNMTRLINDDTSGNFDRAVQLQYVAGVSAVAQECGIFDLPRNMVEESRFFEFFAEFSLAVLGQVNRIRIRNRRGRDPYSVLLTTNTRTKIAFHISRLRHEIEISGLSVNQKKALTGKLDELVDELGNPRIRYARTMAVLSAVLLGLAGVAGATTIAAEGPTAVTNIMKLIAQDKESEDAAALRLAPPPKALPAPPAKRPPAAPRKTASLNWDASQGGDLDDEIPF